MELGKGILRRPLRPVRTRKQKAPGFPGLFCIQKEPAKLSFVSSGNTQHIPQSGIILQHDIETISHV